MSEDLLRSLVDANSDSYNIPGIEINMGLIEEYLSDAGLNLKKIYGQGGHPSLIIDNECKRKEKGFLLVGHIDTVFPENLCKFIKKDDRIMGSGVFDMKSGVVIIIEIMKYFNRTENLALRAIINSDEEIGTKDSIDIFKEYLNGFGTAFVFEGCSEGIVTRRKGVSEVIVTAKGKASHAGSSFFRGENAIRSLTVFIEKVFPKVEPLYENGVTLNLAKLSGGDKFNIVPDTAQAFFDIRYFSDNDLESVKQAFRNAASAELDIVFMDNRPPLPGNADKKILDMLDESFRNNGEKISHNSTGGASDGNFLSCYGLSVIDGLGACGDHDHTANEFIFIDSFKRRIKILIDFFEKIK